MADDPRLPLVERKRLRARASVVRAAEELFSEHGFNAVSVAEIADRAEIGRTTFFRHFGDKQEVVFVQQQEVVASIAAAHGESAAPVPSSPAEAVRQLRVVVLALCAQVTADPDAYTRHYAFIAENAELRARDAIKMQDLSASLADILVVRGADERTAHFASQVALACFQIAKTRQGNDPHSLVAETEAAFEEVLTLGSDRRPTRKRGAASRTR